MAKVKIQGHASGTGILTITAPNTSTDRTITLPDASGALLNSDGDGSSLTGIQSPLVEGTDYLAPDGDGSNLTALDATTLTGNLPAIDGSNLTALDATTLTGNLPAIDGSNLTGVAPTKSVVEALGIDVPATNLTGTVPTARLGTGTADSSVHLRGDGAWASAAAGLNSIQTFTSSGTWTRPSGVTKVIVEVQGGGGSGGKGNVSAALCAGGGGGYSKGLVDVSSISSSTITVGSGGAGATGGTGNSGGASSWADGTNTLTGNGGQGAPNQEYRGGAGGTASGGALNIEGQIGGEWGGNQMAGSSMLGHGGNYSYDSSSARLGTGYGGGGTARHINWGSGNSGAGSNGIVIVTEYK